MKKRTLAVAFTASTGNTIEQIVENDLKRDMFTREKKVCVTNARLFPRYKTFVSEDDGVTLVFRPDLTDYYSRQGVDQTDVIFYFDAKRKVFTNPSPKEDSTILYYQAGDIINLKRSRSMPGNIRAVSGYVQEVMEEGRCLYLKTYNRKTTKNRPAKTLFVMGIKFTADDTVIVKDDLYNTSDQLYHNQI